ncbi:Phytanoyl-CoA dioxygenase [Akanthomyces lecanii RCEF 1005]|uniref:Phytanoyl-CoA dioxygenase n=1 Tax=Akanthomyces lecanii RCEF 1005 TaxID=1081108 RepID=A0A168FSN8_CORDF|nr:Phytanoyl-CoA dioxygenase [Akanthomyces lecanii RCEF 1005]
MQSQVSSEQLQFYKDNGYLVLSAKEHNLVADPGELKVWAEQVRKWPLEKGKWMPYFETTTSGSRQQMRTENFVDYHAKWGELLHGEGLRGILKQLSGEDMILFKDKINYKLPNGNGFHAHVDYHAYSHIGDIAHLTANIAVDEATVANGCLEVVPGSHKTTIEFANGGRISQKWEESREWTQVPLKQGDLLLFGSHLAHRSQSNTTDKSRTSLYATFYMAKDGKDLRKKYYEHRRKVFPPDHEREEGNEYEQGWKTYGFAAPFSTVPTKVENNSSQ